MFLAVREIKHNKLHYGLIMAMIMLIGYLMFMLMGMMLGLANENTAAVRSWDTKTVFLNKNANDNLTQSLITTKQSGHLTKHEALVGTTPAVLQRKTSLTHKQSVQFMGLDYHQYIYKHKLVIAQGHKPQSKDELVLDTSLKNKGYRLGDKVKLNSTSHTYRVVGFVKNAKFNIAPLVIGKLSTWQQLKGTGNQFVGSGIWADRNINASHHQHLEKYSAQKFISKLPGYTAQNSTFEFMIGFLMVISLIIIAVFLYILTMQKLPEYSVLRAQGIPVRVLVHATLSEATILMLTGVVVSLILTLITALIIPDSVPMLINWPLTILMGIALLILGIIGSLLPVRVITRIDPLDAI